MLNIIFCIVAGAAMSIQGVMNTRLGDKAGLFEANMFVQGTAFILSLLAMIFFGKGNLGTLLATEKVYLLGGILGLIITITVMLGIKSFSPTIAISVILVSQLIVAALIDYFGIMGSKKVPFHWTKLVGVALMIIGIIVFKTNFKK